MGGNSVGRFLRTLLFFFCCSTDVCLFQLGEIMLSHGSIWLLYIVRLYILELFINCTALQLCMRCGIWGSSFSHPILLSFLYERCGICLDEWVYWISNIMQQIFVSVSCVSCGASFQKISPAVYSFEDRIENRNKPSFREFWQLICGSKYVIVHNAASNLTTCPNAIGIYDSTYYYIKLTFLIPVTIQDEGAGGLSLSPLGPSKRGWGL